MNKSNALQWLGNEASRRLWFLDGDELCAEARKKAGLEDFGEPGIEPALSILTHSLESEANLHPLGRFLMRMHLQDLLEIRLRLVEAWRREAEALDSTTIERPLFITGMPRSGSTFLHELLAEDPANRAPRVWEVMFPVPESRLSGSGEDPRIRKAAACLWWFRRLAPQADSVYPMRATTPHECVAIHSYTFLSAEFVSTCRVPSYERFLSTANLLPAYAWQLRFLRYLQLGEPARRWVLKSPDHVHGLKELLATFPDALIVQTHRDPLEVLKSSCRLTQVLRGLYGHPRSREEVFASESRVLAASADCFIRFRDEHPELANRIVDVNYDELAANPLGVVRGIYRHLGLSMSGRALERMRSLAAARSRYGNGTVTNEFARLDLDSSAVSSACQRYCERFNIGHERPKPTPHGSDTKALLTRGNCNSCASAGSQPARY